MKGLSFLPVQAAGLAALAVVLSQGATFAVAALAPEPIAAGFSIEAAAAALRDGAAETADGRALRRRISSRPPDAVADRPLAQAIRAVLAHRLGVPAGQVVVNLDEPSRHPLDVGPSREAGPDVVFVRCAKQAGESAPPCPPAPDPASDAGERGTRIHSPGPGAPPIEASTGRRFTVLSDETALAPFSAWLRLEDGRWATVEPPGGPLSPWQFRIGQIGGLRASEPSRRGEA